MKRIKQIFVVLFIIFGAFVFVSDTDVVLAKENKSECSDLNQYECYGKKKMDYNLDTVPDKFAEEETWTDKVNEWIPPLGKLDEFTGDLNPFSHIPAMLNFFANIGFQTNIFLTKVLLTIMDFVYDFDMVNILIENMASKVRAVSGISTDHSIGNGVFGSFITIIVLSSAVYALFMMLFKRSILNSLETVIKTFVVITLSMLLFANYSSFLTGANKITTQASSLILGVSFIDDGEETTNKEQASAFSEDNIRSNMKDNIWEMFVDRPYLYMMFGETSFYNEESPEIRKRFNKIVQYKAESEKRIENLEKEAQKGNKAILHSNVEKRLAFTPIYFFINFMVSLPILILLASIILFQFWFLIMALFAPFALIVAAIPGQFNVLKRYGIELAFPLLAKIGVSFMLLMLFFVSGVIFELDAELTDTSIFKTLFRTDPLAMYIILSLFNLVLFGLFFILRKRLVDILTSGSQALREFKEKHGNPLSQSIKNGVQTTGMIGGAIIGGAATGGAGAVVGANIGRTAGGVATGQAGAQDVANTAIQTQRARDFAKLAQGKEQANQAQEQEQLNLDQQKQANLEKAKDTKVENLNQSDLTNMYNDMDEAEQEEIREAGRHYEELENLNEKPLSDLTKEEYAKLMNAKPLDSEDENGTPLNEKSFDEMNNTEKYKVLKANGTMGKKVKTPDEVNRRNPINIGSMDADALKASPISDFNREEIDEISDKLSGEERVNFVENINSKSLGGFEGKTVEDLTKPIEAPDIKEDLPEDHSNIADEMEDHEVDSRDDHKKDD